MVDGVYRCPRCFGALSPDPSACPTCGAGFGRVHGLPSFVDVHPVGRLDRVMRAIYDGFGWGHDPALRLVLPLVDGVSEATARQRLLDRLPLAALAAIASARPLRVLDVSFGTAGELLGLARTLPAGTALHGVDLSATMARIGARALARAGVEATLCLGDAHHLPYRDEAFDLVVHVGGINAFSDRRAALAEMARVARPGASVFVVDEQLDRSRPLPLWQRGLFRAVTWWDTVQEAPIAELPPDVVDVSVEQILTFYYLLRFTRPPGPPRSP